MSLSFRRLSLIGALVLLAAFAPAARFALAAGYVVTSLADTNTPGTLRFAINQANASPGNDSITFNIAAPKPWIINIDANSSLPALTDQAGVTIDGASATIPPLPQVELRGNGATRGQGIKITSSNNIIRGLSISGFKDMGLEEVTGAGIVVSGYQQATRPSNNLIEYCYLGADVTGNAPGPGSPFNNFNAGIILEYGVQNTTIQQNVISGNERNGISLESSITSGLLQQNNAILNNRIGVNAAGTQALPNGTNGIQISDNSNTTTVADNLISGNGGSGRANVYGVFISGNATGGGFISGNVVKRNLIGTDASGTLKIPNTGGSGTGGGLGLGPSQGTVIGGPSAADGNVISGNQVYGIEVIGQTSGATLSPGSITIQNNKIGVAADGSTPLGNTQSGVLLWQRANGVALGPGNTISGNGLDGVQILAVQNLSGATVQTRGNLITGNAIGTNTGGTAAIPNARAGILLEGATSGNTMLGNTIANNSVGIALQGQPGAPSFSPQQNTIGGNTIRSNGALGIQLLGSSGSNTINAGNTISGHSEAGIQIETSSNLVEGNTIGGNQIGINIINGASNNTIRANGLAQNTLHGVLVSGGGTAGNRITQTTTNANGGRGIALESGGNLGNQPGRPGLSGVAFNGTTLSGSVTNGAGCGGGCTIEVFGGDNPLSDEGPVYLGMFTSAGSFSNISLAACKPFLIFTVTDSAGNTSEFTSPIAAAQCTPSAPAVTLSDATPSPNQSALPGTTKTYSHIVTNSGSAAGALTITASSSNGWSTTLDKSACPATLAPGASCTITLAVQVPNTAQPGESNSTTITASLAGAAASASKTDTTTVLAAPALSLTPDNQTKSTGPGQPISFVHTLANLGNGTDTFAITVTPPSGWSYSVQPAGNISLAPNATAQVTVTYTPPAGIASPPDYVGLVKASSTTDPSVSKTVTDTITITSAAVPQIASVVIPPSVDPGATVQIDYTITNVGNLAGTFNLSFSGPGWPIGAAVPASVTLAPGASQAVSTTLTVPAGAVAGGYAVTLTATDQAAPATSASKTDVIVVRQRGALALGPDQSFTRAPNATYTDTLTLTNNGNFTDTVQLSASSSLGWNVRVISPTVTLNPGGTTQVGVAITIPPGQLAGITDTTTITATSSLPGVTDSATITTTIAAVPGVDITPDTQLRALTAGKSATFDFTLINSGSIAQSFTITRTATPAGWSATLAPLSTVLLQPGQTVPISLTLAAPAGAADGTTASVTLTASCVENSCASSALATARVGPPIDTQIGQNCSQSVLPGTLITCRHTITNTGFLSDTFSLSLFSTLGWSSTYVPSSVFLAPGAAKTVTITLVVPTSAPAGAVENLRLSVRSTAIPSVSREITDTITVLQFGAVSFTPSQTRPPTPGQSITFIHTLQNIGNGLDSFTITATQELDWKITITPTQTTTLAPGISYPVTVQVDVPAGATSKSFNRITVRARSVFSPNAQAVLTDLIGVLNAPSNPIYLPLIMR